MFFFSFLFSFWCLFSSPQPHHPLRSSEAVVSFDFYRLVELATYPCKCISGPQALIEKAYRSDDRLPYLYRHGESFRKNGKGKHYMAENYQTPQNTICTSKSSRNRRSVAARMILSAGSEVRRRKKKKVGRSLVKRVTGTVYCTVPVECSVAHSALATLT